MYSHEFKKGFCRQNRKNYCLSSIFHKPEYEVQLKLKFTLPVTVSMGELIKGVFSVIFFVKAEVKSYTNR